MRNIDKDITKLYTKTTTEELPVIPEEPEIKSPHLLGEDEIMNQISNIVEGGSTSQDTINKINKLAQNLDYEHEGSISTTKPSATVADTADMEDIITAPVKAYSAPVVRHHTGGGNGGGGGMGKGKDPGGGAAGSPFYKGGRVDKALTGRSRDI